MSVIIPAILALLQTIIPSIGSATAIGQIIGTLTSILPVIVKEVQDLIPMVKNIIAALKDNKKITAEQMTALEALDAKCDADFEQAATLAQDHPNAFTDDNSATLSPDHPNAHS